MSEAVYHLDGVRLKALAYLRKHGPSTVEQIATGLGIPDWAVRPALDSAEVAGLAEPTADGVWGIKVPSLNYDPSDPDKMRLPRGVTCGLCVHIRRCKAIYGHIETDTYCDWSPSRFHAAKATGQEGRGA